MGDYRDPVFRRAEIARLREENAATEVDMRARWMTEELPEPPNPPRTERRAQRPPDGAAMDARARAIAEQIAAQQIAGLLDSIGQVIAEERAAHRKELRRLKFALRDLRRALHKQLHDAKVRLVA